MNVKSTQGRGIPLKLGLHFQDYLILISRSVDRRYLARAKGIAQGRLDLLNGHAQRRSLFAINIDVDLRGINLQIAIDILNQRQIAHGLFKNSGVVVELPVTGSLNGNLVKAATRLTADIEGRRILNNY